MRTPIALVVASVLTATASAQIVGDFDFANLSAEYVSSDADSGLLSIVADGDASGSVGRFLGGTDYAFFPEGFSVTFGPAAFEIDLAISNVLSGAPTGFGTFTITDVDGDTLSGTVDGSWQTFGGVAFFTGDLSDVSFSSPNSPFDGGDEALTAFAGTYFGAIQLMSIDARFVSTFFSDDVQNTVISAQAQLIPAPAGLVALAAGFGLRRRRR